MLPRRHCSVYKMARYTGDQCTVGALVSRRFTLMEYTDDEAIPAVVLEQLVSQINQAVDAPVQDLFSRDTNPLVARVTRNGKSRMRAGCSTLEGRLTRHTPDTWTPLPCSINDIPLLFRIVGGACHRAGGDGATQEHWV